MSPESDATRLSVLYIEDNASNLQLVKRIFRDRHDIELRTASRGQEGVGMARDLIPGLILLDLHLPDMPGAEVLSALQSEPLTAAIPVVVVSADATIDQIKHLRSHGVADYVTKPFEVPRLLAVVDSFIAPQAAPAAEPQAANGAAHDGVILDPGRVAELFALDPDGATFRSLAAVALDEAAHHVAAVAGADATAVGAAAHSLKSSAAIVGGRRLASLADAIEQAARGGSLPDPSMLSELRRTLMETKQAAIDAGGER
jgi:CheY-like chemotaxis protein